MARTIEQILEVQVGKMQLMLASYMAQTEALLEQIQALEHKILELEAVQTGGQDGHKPHTRVEKEI